MFQLSHSRPIAARTLLTILVSLSVITVNAAFAAAATPLVVASGPSPFAKCTFGAGPSAINFLNAEVEPYVAVNPTNPQNLIGVWQQDRWSDGGAHGLVAGYSNDGGATWKETPLPFSTCTPGGVPYERASDPWVSFGPDGTAYTISISFNESSNANGVAAATSTDGGKTWKNLNILIADNAPNFQFFNDKESITADPLKAGTAYAVWDRLEEPNGNPRANLHTSAYKGPSYFSKTTDGGKTWSTPQVIVDIPSSNKQTIGNQIVVNRQNGTLYDFFDLITPPNGVTAYKVAFVKSTDGGATWTQPQIVADLESVGVIDPNNGFQIRTGDIIPEVAINAQTGQLYAVWQDSRFNGGHYDEVAFSTSTDGGATWSTPVQVNTPSGKAAFTPSVQANANGTIAVTYYDFRNLQAGNTATLPTDYWYTSSTNGGASFGDETHLGGPFDMLTAPNAVGFFTGDYEGLGVSGTTFYPFVVLANSGNAKNPTDVFTTRVVPSSTALTTSASSSPSTTAPNYVPPGN